MRIQTGRNPFAREDITKRMITGTCAWCGNSLWRNGKASGKVWQYHVAHDDGTRNDGPIAGGRGFCGISCLNDWVS